MPKITKRKDEEVEVIEDDIVEEEIAEEVEEEKPKKKSVRNSDTEEITLIRNHSCNIGGIQYHFIAGKEYEVPASVKSILKDANLLAVK